MADKAAVGVMKEKPNPEDPRPNTHAAADAESGSDAVAGVRGRDPVWMAAVALVAIAFVVLVVALNWLATLWGRYTRTEGDEREVHSDNDTLPKAA